MCENRAVRAVCLEEELELLLDPAVAGKKLLGELSGKEMLPGEVHVREVLEAPGDEGAPAKADHIQPRKDVQNNLIRH